jgi:2-polyprenyl-3-methyl-5-hydroxy-6-metoxy-1,4-benzoquinol methylase
MTTSLDAAAEANFGAERVTHLYANDLYYAHLSLYYFAAQFAQNSVVLDAGSGAGYGSAYLADHGAQFVHGIDVSAEAVAFSERYFQRPNLQYQVMSLEEITGFEPHSFDLIYSSNVLEHVPNVAAFLRSACELLTPEGVMIVAVPPVIHDMSRAENVANEFHFNIWSPRQWNHILKMFFSDVQSYRHFWRSGFELNPINTPEQSMIRESDFTFDPMGVEKYFYIPSMTVLFVVRAPRNLKELSAADKPLEFVDESFTISANDPAARQAAADALLMRASIVQTHLASYRHQEQAEIVQNVLPPEGTAQLQAVVAERDRLHAVIAEKNRHIEYLERLIQRIQNGRMMRLLKLLNDRRM